MLYKDAGRYLSNLKVYEDHIKYRLDLDEADNYRKGEYRMAIEEIKLLKAGEIEMEDMFEGKNTAFRRTFRTIFLDMAKCPKKPIHG